MAVNVGLCGIAQFLSNKNLWFFLVLSRMHLHIEESCAVVNQTANGIRVISNVNKLGISLKPLLLQGFA